MNHEYKFIFAEEFKDGYPYSIFTPTELSFFESKDLIIPKSRTKFKVQFVGEIITPDGKYFSVPKNFPPLEESIPLFKKVLSSYRDFKGSDGKVLLQNNSFRISSTGEMKSERFYFDQLKEFFLDYITYEFIYPEKRKMIHSATPILGGKINVFETVKKRKQMGAGVTYMVKDIANSDEWNLDDIYWTVVWTLAQKYGTPKEIDQIESMREMLLEQGFLLKIVDISDPNIQIRDIDSCKVGIVHQVIKSTLISFFNSQKISESYKIRVFYTNDFAYVWEELVRKSLKESSTFRSELKHKFNTKQNFKNYFKTHAEMDEWRKKYSSVVNIIGEILDEKGGYIKYEKKVSSIPDLFSDYNGIRFIGDAKYYKDPQSAKFEKEMREYNIKSDNQYPMVILVPADTTNFEQGRSEDNLELVILSISVQTAIDSAVNNNDRLITQVHEILRKFSRRLKSVI